MKKITLLAFIIFAFFSIKAQIFSSKNVISSNINNPETVISADFNNDGYIDVIFSTITDHKIAVCLFNPTIDDFDPQQIITTSFTYAVSMFPADLDGDNATDFLVVSQLSNKVAWFKNDGSGNFTLQTLINDSAQGASSVIAVDIDGDTDLDVVSCAKTDNKILWYANDGSGNFSAPNEITASAEIPVVIISADIDNDNDQDIIAGYGQTDKIVSFTNNGSGTFGSAVEITDQTDYIYSIKAADFNDDGKIDIVSVSKSDNKLAWYKNNGNGTFSNQNIISTDISMAYCVDVADFDLDNDIDIVCTAQGSGKIYIFSNSDGNGTFTEQTVISKKTDGAKGVSVADFDNDGDIDFVAVLSTVDPDEVAWFENGKENFVLHNINTNHDINEIFAYDINNNGYKDIFYTSSTGVYWVANNGDETFSSENTISNISYNIFAMKLADLDNDSDMDVIVADAQGDKIFWIPNTDGNGTFGSEIMIDQTCNGPVDIALYDFDNDNDMDFISSLANEHKIYKYVNNGTGSFTKILLTDTIAQCRIGLSDIDNDGDKDLVYSTYTYTGCLLNDGSGNFNDGSAIIDSNTPNGGAGVILSADLNNDGYDEIIANQNLLAKWYINNQNNTFEGKDVSLWGSAYDLAVGDLDNDTDPDIAVVCRSVGYVYYCENINWGDTIIARNTIAVEDAKEVEIADLNNDGYNDIIVGTWPYQSINWLENNTYRILKEPFDQFVCEGNNAYFSVISTGVKIYKWQINTGSGFTDITNDATYSGADKAQLKINSVTADMFGNQFRCLVYNKDNEQLITETATLNQYTASVQCIENQARTADNSNNYTVVGTEFDLDTIYNKCNETLTVTNDYNSTATLAGEILTEGTHTITWTIKNTSNEVVDECSFDIEIQNYVGINNIYENEISIFPNPTNGIFRLTNVPQELSNVQITNITGKIIYNTTMGHVPLQIDISNQSEGIYFIKIQTENNIIIKKIIKK